MAEPRLCKECKKPVSRDADRCKKCHREVVRKTMKFSTGRKPPVVPFYRTGEF